MQRKVKLSFYWRVSHFLGHTEWCTDFLDLCTMWLFPKVHLCAICLYPYRPWEQSSFWAEPYLPEVFRICIWWEIPWRQTSTFVWSYPRPQWNVLFSTNTVTRPRNTRCTEVHFIREGPYGVREPRLLVVSSKLLFLRWYSLWKINERFKY